MSCNSDIIEISQAPPPKKKKKKKEIEKIYFCQGWHAF